MKKVILFLLISVLIMEQASADEHSNANPAVIENFKSCFGEKTQASWFTLEGFYIARFQKDGKFMEAFFYGDGDLLGYGIYIRETELPEKISAAFYKKFPEAEIGRILEFRPDQEGREFIISFQEGTKRVIAKLTCRGHITVYAKFRMKP